MPGKFKNEFRNMTRDFWDVLKENAIEYITGYPKVQVPFVSLTFSASWCKLSSFVLKEIH